MVQEFVDALRDNGHDVIDFDEGARDGKDMVTVAAQVTIEGEEFDAEHMVYVSEEGVESHGVDIHSFEGDSFDDEREALLDRISTHRDVLGDDAVAWTYFQGAANEDNIDELTDDLQSVHASV